MPTPTVEPSPSCTFSGRAAESIALMLPDHARPFAHTSPGTEIELRVDADDAGKVRIVGDVEIIGGQITAQVSPQRSGLQLARSRVLGRVAWVQAPSIIEWAWLREKPVLTIAPREREVNYRMSVTDHVECSALGLEAVRDHEFKKIMLLSRNEPNEIRYLVKERIEIGGEYDKSHVHAEIEGYGQPAYVLRRAGKRARVAVILDGHMVIGWVRARDLTEGVYMQMGGPKWIEESQDEFTEPRSCPGSIELYVRGPNSTVTVGRTKTLLGTKPVDSQWSAVRIMNIEPADGYEIVADNEQLEQCAS